MTKRKSIVYFIKKLWLMNYQKSLNLNKKSQKFRLGNTKYKLIRKRNLFNNKKLCMGN